MNSNENVVRFEKHCEKIAMLEPEEGKNISDTCEIIRLNDDVITINQPQIRNIVREVLRCDDAENIRQKYSDLCLQHKDIWIKVRL